MASGRPADIRAEFSKLLSTAASTRATAYSMSNKIISAGGAGGKVFVAWLDHVSEIMIRTLERASGEWTEAVHLGTGADNHSGPAITMDADGHLYAAFGPHFGPFQLVRSKRPRDASEWDRLPEFGVNGTYPSLVFAADGTLHCAYRGGEGQTPARLVYQRMDGLGEWTAPREVVTSGLERIEGEGWAVNYTQYGNSLAAGADGRLHLGFHIYDSRPPGGKAVGYLCSDDGGETWLTADGARVELPAGPGSECLLEEGPELDMRIGNVALGPEGRPWITVPHLEAQPFTVALWRHDGKAWHSRDLVAASGDALGGRGLCDGTLTFDAAGTLYVAATAIGDDVGTETSPLIPAKQYFGHPSCEIVVLTSSDRGDRFELTRVSEEDGALSSWLPSIERPFGPRPIEGVPSVIYTHGGPGEGTKGGDATEALFVRVE